MTTTPVDRISILKLLGRAKMTIGLAIGYALGEYVSPLGYTRGRDDFVTGTINGVSIVIGLSVAGAIMGLLVDLFYSSRKRRKSDDYQRKPN